MSDSSSAAQSTVQPQVTIILTNTTFFEVTGTCTACGAKQHLDGFNVMEDAILLFRQEHYADYCHTFIGKIDVIMYKTDQFGERHTVHDSSVIPLPVIQSVK